MTSPLTRFGQSIPPNWVQRAVQTALAAALGFGLLTPVFGTSDVALAQETVSFSTAEAAPADSVAYLVTTLDDQSAQWQLADALLDRAGVGAQIDEMVAEDLTDDSGAQLPLDAFLGGEVAVIASDVAIDMAVAESIGTADMDAMMVDLGLATPEAESGEPEAQGVAVVLDARAPDTAWAAIRESAAEDTTLEELTYEGTTILYGPPATDDDDGMAFARVGDLILFAGAPVDLHPIIDTLAGANPAISTLPEFTQAQDALPAEFLMFGLFNGQSVADTDFGAFETATGGLETTGFSALTVAADQPGFRIESVVLSGEPAAPAAMPAELIERAPADAIFFMSASELGATGALDALGAGLLGLAFGMQGAGAATDPGASPEEAIAAQYEAAAALLGINLQTEFFQQLVGEFGFWLSSDPTTQQVSGLFASGVGEPATVANALMQLSFLLQGAAGSEAPVTTRDVDGDQIYVIGTGDDAGSTVEFGVVGDQLVVGSGDAVAQFSAPEGESLADSQRFQAATGTLPADRSSLIYVDLVAAIPLLESASEEAGALASFDDAGQIEDASPSCANYAAQADAQAAYDAAEPDTFDLDQDFDGEVCEDFFAADVSAETEATETEDPLADIDLSGFESFALVGYAGEDGLARTSTLLAVAE